MDRVETLVENHQINELWMSSESVETYTQDLCSCGFDIKQADSEFCFDCNKTKKSPIFEPSKNPDINISDISDMET